MGRILARFQRVGKYLLFKQLLKIVVYAILMLLGRCLRIIGGILSKPHEHLLGRHLKSIAVLGEFVKDMELRITDGLSAGFAFEKVVMGVLFALKSFIKLLILLSTRVFVTELSL